MECDVVKKNLGVSQCNKMPEMIMGMITTPNDFVIPAETLADPGLLLEYLNDAILAPAGQRIYYWPSVKGFENISQEAVYEDSPYAYLPVRDGNYRFKFMFRENLCLHKAMYSHRANTGRVIFIDSENQLFMTETADGEGKGFQMQLLHTEKLVFNDGSVATKSPVVVALQNNKEIDTAGLLVQFDSFSDLNRIVDQKLKVIGSPTATTIVVEVMAECDATPLNGLVVADFLLVDDDNGATHAITTATPDPSFPGRYTLAGTAFEASKLGLKPAGELSVEGYESIAPVQITVGALLRDRERGEQPNQDLPGGAPGNPGGPTVPIQGEGLERK
jgi:hypothetical protein